MSGESRNDGEFAEAAAGGDCAGEIVAIGAGDAFDDAELAQTGEVSGGAAGEHWAASGRRSARRRPAMLKPGRCKAASRVCLARLKKFRCNS